MTDPSVLAHNYNTERKIRACQYAESHLLQLVKTIEHQTELRNKQQGLLDQFINRSKENEKKLRARLKTAPTSEITRLSRLLVVLLSRRRKTMSDTRQQDRSMQKTILDFKTSFGKYLELKRTIGARRTCVKLHEANVSAHTGGQTLMGKLGMILFAWKSSNAFDDLARLSGRK